ncbi:MAG TPA: BTAD domain-containing putative transcriptional regulator, partial [Chloroflexota bacterium]|nr:BTAD domain-containing putative transcriptional regulator [Chloroflexota bacterium]
MRIEARLLGSCVLRSDGRPIAESAFRRRRTLVLLLFLLSVPHHRAPREQVLELLWPEQDPEESERGLRVVLTDLRAGKAGPTAHTVIIGRGPLIELHPDLDLAVDADAFEVAARQALAQPDLAALRHAAALYTGPYLPNRPGEDWALARRAHLSHLHDQVLSRLASMEEDTDPTSAERRLRELLRADRTAEPTARRLMELMARQGRRAEALRVYQALAAALRDDLGLAPAAETEATRIRLLSAEPAGAIAADPRSAAEPSPRQTNLPAPLTSFIGREWGLTEVKSLLLQPPSGCRVVTLTGPGGCGKTRLALEAAGTMLPRFPDGVWLVELASLSDPALVPRALATILGVQEQALRGGSLTDLVAEVLHRQQALVVLDNCEHVLGAAAALAAAVVHACPQVHVLTTSREALGIVGEITWLVPSLSVPPAGGPQAETQTGPAQLLQFGAVRLFLERARASRPGFAITAANAAAVARICRRLDGIPLAIELAAAQLRALSIHDLAGRLDDRFRLLSSGTRATLPRHRTLQAVMDWSYALLQERERLVLQRLAVFAGGCTLEAAETVCAGGEIDPPAVLSLLTRLVTKSLVQLEERLDQQGLTRVRYSLLETVRQYARERSVAAGAGREETAARQHATYFLRLAEHAELELTGPDQVVWLRRLEQEHDNLRAALSWSCADAERVLPPAPATHVEDRSPGRDQIAVRLAGALWRFWLVRGHLNEGSGWLESILQHSAGVTGPLRGKALNGAGNLAWALGNYERAIAFHRENLLLQQALGDKKGISGALRNLGNVAGDQGDYEQAARLHGESLAL